MLKNPLIFIPGILGSTIQAKEYFTWWDAWPATATSWLKMMSFSTPGTPEYLCKCLDVVRVARFGEPPISLMLKQPIYQTTLDDLQELGYRENINLFLCPYDFRYDIKEAASRVLEPEISQAPSLKIVIRSVMEKLAVRKVDLLCHSMGGLVALQYMIDQVKETGNIDHISNVVFLGTPIFGAAAAFAKITCGLPPDEAYDQLERYWSPTKLEWKTISRLFTAPYQLIPSKPLVDGKGSFVSINSLEQSYDDSHYRHNHGLIGRDVLISKELLQLSYDWKDEFIGNLTNKEIWDSLKTHLHFFQGFNCPTPVKYDIEYPESWDVARITHTDTDLDGDGSVLNYGVKEVLGVSDDFIHRFDKVAHLDLARNKQVLAHAKHVFSSSI